MNAKSLMVVDLAREWLKDPAFKAEYDALEEEFRLAADSIRANIVTDASEFAKARRRKHRVRFED